MIYKVELIDEKFLLAQSEASKSSIDDILDEAKSLKYQITIKTELKKCKQNEIEFPTVYFNSTTKTVVNHRFSLDKFFKEILYRIEKWINKGSDWIIESINSQYINISTLRPLAGSSYIKLPVKLRSSKNGLINIKNNNHFFVLFFGVILDTQTH